MFYALNLLILCNNHLYKSFHFINATLAYIIRSPWGWCVDIETCNSAI